MPASSPSYVQRLADRSIQHLLDTFPALLITGPRATGKTTTARRYARSVVALDRPAEAAAFIADPDATLASYEEPVLLDEWQEVPSVLGAIKRTVDADPRPGRFLVTGSVRGDLDGATWPGTGRLVRVPMYGLTQRELHGRTAGIDFIDALASGNLDALGQPDDPPDLVGYVEAALRGGFPDASIDLATTDRALWLTSYLEQLLTRDAVGASDRDPARIARYFEALALNSAGVVNDRTLFETAGIDRLTAHAYERLLVNLAVLDVVPTWYTNRLTRLVKAPKRYLVDPSLMAAALRLDLHAVLRDGHLLGRLLDTFVAAQIRPEASLSAGRPRLHHLRDKGGRHELDLVLELGTDRVVALEVKASAAPTSGDARHLIWLRQQLGDRFVAGAVLHTGPRSFVLDDRIAAVPIASIWNERTQ